MIKHRKDMEAIAEAYNNDIVSEKGGFFDKTLAKSPIAKMFGGVSDRAQGRVTAKSDVNQMMKLFNQSLGRNKGPVDVNQFISFLGNATKMGNAVEKIPMLQQIKSSAGIAGGIDPGQVKKMMPDIIDQLHDFKVGGASSQGPGQQPQYTYNPQAGGAAPAEPQAGGAAPAEPQAGGAPAEPQAEVGGGTPVEPQAGGAAPAEPQAEVGGAAPAEPQAGGAPAEPQADGTVPGADVDGAVADGQSDLDGLSPEELSELETSLGGAEAGGDPAAKTGDTTGEEPAAAPAAGPTEADVENLADAISAMAESGKSLKGTAGLMGLTKVFRDTTGKDLTKVINIDPKIKQIFDRFVAEAPTARSNVREMELANYLLNHQGIQGGVVNASTEVQGNMVNEQRVYNTLGSMGFMSGKWGRF